jgi:uncharacterized protein YjdB
MMIYDIPPEDAPIIPDLTLDRANITIAEGETEVLTAKTIPADQTVTWTSSDDTVATVEDGEVTAVAEGTAVITASMTYETVEYKDTCKVTVTA